MIDSKWQNGSSPGFESTMERREAPDGIGPSVSKAARTVATSQLKLRSVPNRILICRPNGRLGNALLLTPLVQELEQLFPGAEIDIVSACPATAEIFREYSSVQTIHRLPRLGARHPLTMLAKLFIANRTRYDLVIDPCPQSWSSRFWTRCMYARADKLGFQSTHKNIGVNLSVAINSAPPHMAQYPAHLIRQVLVGRVANHEQRAMPQLSIKLTLSERELGIQALNKLFRARELGQPIVGLFLNATGAKRLAIDFWRRLITRLQRELPNVQVLEIVPACGERLLPETPGYFSTSIRRIASVIAATDWFVSADCGIMHLGAATDTPTFGLFKVTDSAKYGPYGGRSAAIQVDDRCPDPAIERIARDIALGLKARKQAAA